MRKNVELRLGGCNLFLIGTHSEFIPIFLGQQRLSCSLLKRFKERPSPGQWDAWVNAGTVLRTKWLRNGEMEKGLADFVEIFTAGCLYIGKTFGPVGM